MSSDINSPQHILDANKGKFPMTKMGTAFVVRKVMIEAAEYGESLSRYEEESSEKENAVRPKRNLGHEAMMLVVNHELPVHVHASPVDDIMTAVRLHDEFGFSKLSIGHGTESYKIADILAEKGIMVIVGPQMIAFDDDGNLINLAGFLVDHGVEVNIMTDADVVQQEYLRFQAAIAVKYGLDPAEALKAITINPARWAGLDDRIGSIEEGKDADLVLFDGDPFDVLTSVELVFIDGEVVFDGSVSGEEGGSR